MNTIEGKYYGFLLNFYKAASFPKNKSKIIHEYPNNGDWSGAVSFSFFDRVEVLSIKKYSEIRSQNNVAKKWLGERQFAVISRTDTDSPKLSFKDGERCKFPFYKQGHNHNFFGITLISLSDTFYDYLYSNECSLKIMAENLEEVINRIKTALGLNGCIEFEIFGSISSCDLVIIWLSDNLKDIIQVLSCFRKSAMNTDNEIISDSYTILGAADINSKNNIFQDQNGSIALYLTQKKLNSNPFFKELIAKLNPGIQKITVGRYDVQYIFPVNELSNELYQKENLIHYGSKLFNTNIIQCYTQYFCEIDDRVYEKTSHIALRDFPGISVNGDNEMDPPDQIKYNDYYDKVEKTANKPIFSNTNYISDTLWLLLEDFNRNLSSATSYPWSQDLPYQFSKTFDLIDRLVDSGFVAHNVIFQCVHHTANLLRQTMMHISQSSNSFLEAPSTQIIQTGSYGKILRSYYGFIKKLIILGYAINKNDDQMEIIPYIHFDVSPIITSTLYYHTAKFKASRALSINMPYSALIQSKRYFPLLIHEIFHYISPKDRRSVNMTFACITLALNMKYAILEPLMERIYDSGRFEHVDFEEIKNFSLFLLKMAEKLFFDTISEYHEQLFCDLYAEYGNSDSDKFITELMTSFNSGIKDRFVTIFGEYCDKNRENIHSLYIDYDKRFKEIYYDNTNIPDTDKHLASEPEVPIARTGIYSKHKQRKIIYEQGHSYLEKMYDSLFIPNHNIKDESLLSYFNYPENIINANMDNYVGAGQLLKYAYKEAYADIHMIMIMEYDIEAYLGLFFNIMNQLSLSDSRVQQYRIAIVIDHYLARRNNGRLIPQDEILPPLMEIANKFNTSKFSPMLSQLSNSPEEFIGGAYDLYFESYPLYREAIYSLLQNIDIENYKNESPLFAKVFSDLKNKIAPFKSDEFDDSFELNLKIINNFQIQESLQTIRNILDDSNRNKDVS